MQTPDKIAEDYIAVWNEPDAAERRRRLAQGWASDASYADPLMAATGHGDIAAMIEGARAQFPGFAFALIGTPDGHGDFVRFSWKAGPNGGDSLIEGTDVVKLDPDRRIATVIGFLDKAPAA
jgi:hypothetical protein